MSFEIVEDNQIRIQQLYKKYELEALTKGFEEKVALT